MPWQRTSERKCRRQEFASDAHPLYAGGSLKLSAREPGAVDRCSEPTKIPVTKDRGIQDIDCLIIETFEDCTGEVEAGIVYQHDWPRLKGIVTSSTDYYHPVASNNG